MMDNTAACQPLDLACNECCCITLCPQCQAIHLRIGPVSLKLPPHAFRAVSGAMRQAEERLPAHLSGEAPPDPGYQGTRH